MKPSFGNLKTQNSCKTKRSPQSNFNNSEAPHPTAGLQRTIGNRSVQRIMASQLAPVQRWDAPAPDNQASELRPKRYTKTPGHRKTSPASATIQRWELDDILDTARDAVGIGSQIAGPLNLIDKAGYLGGGTSGLLGAASPVLGVAAPALALASGVSTLMDEDATTEETVLGGLKTAGGAAGLLGKGLMIAGGEMGALGGSSLFGMSAGTALTGGGAGLGTAAGAGAAASSAGAVALAGAAGYGLGRLLDRGVGGLMDVTGAGGLIDDLRGISRPEGQTGDYSLSGMGADIMTGLDQSFTGAMRGLGVYDEDRPAYTQSIGWRLAEILPSWMQ